jgi:dihydrofolate reductase
MRNILGAAFVSLDGVMQAPGGPSEDPTGSFAHGGWLPQFFDEDVGAAISAFFDRDYALLLGRRTYDVHAGEQICPDAGNAGPRLVQQPPGWRH